MFVKVPHPDAHSPRPPRASRSVIGRLAVRLQRAAGEDEAKGHISASAFKGTKFPREEWAARWWRVPLLTVSASLSAPCRMAAASHPSLFFVGLPDVRKLCCVTASLQDDEEPRSLQIQTCRELVLMYSDILAAPDLDSLTDFTVVMAIQFFQKGILQAFGWRRHLLMGPPQRVCSDDLQRCVSFSLMSRLSPSWNKVGRLLVHRSDFLSESGKLDAVTLDLSTTESQLCVSVEVSTVTLPPSTLQDLDLPPPILSRFCSDPSSVFDPASIRGPVWCHVLPSMKKGQIVSISRQLPEHAPFRSYRELQEHWNLLYGYQLPELAEEELVYCTVYFRPLREKLFTYPLICIRLQPERLSPSADLQGVLCSFLSDLQRTLQSFCSFPARLSRVPVDGPGLCLNTAMSTQQLDGTTFCNSETGLELGSRDAVEEKSLLMKLTDGGRTHPGRLLLPQTPPLPTGSSKAPPLIPAVSLGHAPQQELSGVGRGCSSSQGSPAPKPSFAQQQQRGSRLRGRLTLPAVRKAVPTPSSFHAPPRPVIPCITSSPTPPPRETPPPPLMSSEASARIKGGAAELKERSRQTNRHADVEEAARNNQLSRLSSATLLSWLRGRGEPISAKHRKEELMLKVIHCLAEV